MGLGVPVGAALQVVQIFIKLQVMAKGRPDAKINFFHNDVPFRRDYQWPEAGVWLEQADQHPVGDADGGQIDQHDQGLDTHELGKVL